MCQQCAIREMQAHENLEAADLLKMLIGKIHAGVDDDGQIEIRAGLAPEDVDRLAAGRAASEDAEIDDPEEEDMPAEASEQLHTDCRDEPYKPPEMKPARRIKR
jgi:hypothetical protein